MLVHSKYHLHYYVPSKQQTAMRNVVVLTRTDQWPLMPSMILDLEIAAHTSFWRIFFTFLLKYFRFQLGQACFRKIQALGQAMSTIALARRLGKA